MEGLSDREGSNRKKFYLVSVSAATGSLHKAVVPQNSSAYLVEEIQLSPDSEPVRNLQLAPAQVSRDLNRIQLSCGEHLGGPPRQGARAPDTPHLFPRVQCSQASLEASGEFPGPTAVSTRAAWTVFSPGTLTVPGTPKRESAACCLALPCESAATLLLQLWLLFLPLQKGPNTLTPRFQPSGSTCHRRPSSGQL